MQEPDVRVVIVEPDPTWPRRFHEEQARLMEALGVPASDVQHIGPRPARKADH